MCALLCVTQECFRISESRLASVGQAGCVCAALPGCCECCPSPGASGWIVLCGSSRRALGHLRNAHQMGSPQGYQVLKLPCYSPRKILLTLICGGCVSPVWAAPSPCVTIPNHHNHSVSALGHKPACWHKGRRVTSAEGNSAFLVARQL